MRKTLLLFLLFITAVSEFCAAQIDHGIQLIDTAVIQFNPDSTLHLQQGPLKIDTSGMGLWQIGKTVKPFFSPTDTAFGLMTDTTQSYPVNSNSSFVVKFESRANAILSFTHKYQTTSGKDGGIIEFSLDSGLTWQKLRGNCYDSSGLPYWLFENMYSVTDTLADGQPAFSGQSAGWQTTSIQLLFAIPVRVTGSCNLPIPYNFYFRFRFVSDSIADSLDGWLINRFKVEYDYYGSGVNNVQYNLLPVAPNPSASGIFIFPALEQNNKFRIIVCDVQGRVIKDQPYTNRLDLSESPSGVYFYRISNGTVQYNGKLVK